MAVAVYIPTPWRDLTSGRGHVHAEGTTISEVIADLDRQFPGLHDLICDGRTIRVHVNVFVDGDEIRSLQGDATPLRPGADIAFIPALAGGSFNSGDKGD